MSEPIMGEPIMGTEMVAIRGWGQQRQRIAFARLHTGDTTTRYYTEADVEKLIADMLACAGDWSVGIHWSVPEDYAEQFARVQSHQCSAIKYCANREEVQS